ncbi:MAG: hypothetical protein V7K53_04310 [Nostoc sp.]|uniref:hypothetical protein n=1 Tax=Nostoc sp. TaxID=1180 RepID=UPI002FF4D2DC
MNKPSQAIAIYDRPEDLLQHYDFSILGANLNTIKSTKRISDRSRFINEAVQYYTTQKALVNLGEQ